MLTVNARRRYRDCDGQTRCDFLKVGGLGLGAPGLPNLPAARTEAVNAAKQSKIRRSSGCGWVRGPTHVETFDPKMTAPVENRSVAGEVKTVLPGVSLGGNFEQMAQVADKMAFVRSFAHDNSG